MKNSQRKMELHCYIFLKHGYFEIKKIVILFTSDKFTDFRRDRYYDFTKFQIYIEITNT